MILQSNPHAGYLARRRAIDSSIRRCLDSGWYILGPEVRQFEREFASFIGCEDGVGVASGTDAIELALAACGIGRGDVVLTVSHTAVATVVAIRRAGAVPVLVDIDPRTYTLCPDALARAAKRIKAKAIVPVHLYGQPCDIQPILALARRHHWKVIEDCAQAHGAAIGRARVGSLGHAAAFSFYPTKNLGALGDGGMIVTGDPAISQRARLLREYGWKKRYVSAIADGAMNSRLDELQAAILRAKLPHLDEDNARRRAIAKCYDRWVARAGLQPPVVRPGVKHVYHQYVVRVPNREAVMEELRQRGIGTGVHYPVPVHLQPAFRRLRRADPLPHTEQAAGQILSLPMYPQLSMALADAIGEALVEVLKPAVRLFSRGESDPRTSAMIGAGEGPSVRRNGHAQNNGHVKHNGHAKRNGHPARLVSAAAGAGHR